MSRKFCDIFIHRSLDFEDVQNYVKKEIKAVKHCNLNNLYSVIEKAWENILSNRCITYVNSMHRRCVVVIKNKCDLANY